MTREGCVHRHNVQIFIEKILAATNESIAVPSALGLK